MLQWSKQEMTKRTEEALGVNALKVPHSCYLQTSIGVKLYLTLCNLDVA